jgi:hypothetical protein
VRLVDRFLMYYIHTANPLERTARWLERLDGGVDYLRHVVVDGGEGGDFGSTVEVSGDATVLTKMTPGATYRLFVSGLTAKGNVAPDPNERGERPAGTFLAQTVDTKVVTGPPRYLPGSEAITGSLESASVFGFDAARITVIAKDIGDVATFTSQSRGRSFEKSVIDSGSHPRAAMDPGRDMIVVCYQKPDGLWVAMSSDRGRTFKKKLLAAGEGPGCGVALGKDATFLISAEAGKQVKVYRTADGAAFEPAVIGADVTSGDARSSTPVIAADPRRGRVFVAYVQQGAGAGGDTDVYVSASQDNGKSFVSNGGRVVGVLAHNPSQAVQGAPALAVDPENGRLYVAWEDRKTGRSLILLAISEDGGATVGGRLDWQPGKELGNLERTGTSLRVQGGKLLVAFSGAATSVDKRPYLTRFDADANDRAGGFEPPEPGADKAKLLSPTSVLATSGASGPVLGGDGLVSTYVVWTTNKQGTNGNVALSVSP